jgi:hypothetical protein
MDRGLIYLLDTKNGEQREVLMNEVVKMFLRNCRGTGKYHIFSRKRMGLHTRI